jgi:hypothetical protein
MCPKTNLIVPKSNAKAKHDTKKCISSSFNHKPFPNSQLTSTPSNPQTSCPQSTSE